jgi:hypothetical protein
VGETRHQTASYTLLLRLQWWTRLDAGSAIAPRVEWVAVPSTSSFSILSRDSSILVPLSNSSFVLSKSFRAVTTTGAFVVCSTRFARAKPMPREAGDINDQGGMSMV